MGGRGTGRDVERDYPTHEAVAEPPVNGAAFRIQVARERIRVPAHAVFSVEHERGDGEAVVELQLTWTLVENTDGPDDTAPVV